MVDCSKRLSKMNNQFSSSVSHTTTSGTAVSQLCVEEEIKPTFLSKDYVKKATFQEHVAGKPESIKLLNSEAHQEITDVLTAIVAEDSNKSSYVSMETENPSNSLEQNIVPTLLSNNIQEIVRGVLRKWTRDTSHQKTNTFQKVVSDVIDSQKHSNVLTTSENNDVNVSLDIARFEHSKGFSETLTLQKENKESNQQHITESRQQLITESSLIDTTDNEVQNDKMNCLISFDSFTPVIAQSKHRLGQSEYAEDIHRFADIFSLNQNEDNLNIDSTTDISNSSETMSIYQFPLPVTNMINNGGYKYDTDNFKVNANKVNSESSIQFTNTKEGSTGFQQVQQNEEMQEIGDVTVKNKAGNILISTNISEQSPSPEEVHDMEQVTMRHKPDRTSAATNARTTSRPSDHRPSGNQETNQVVMRSKANAETNFRERTEKSQSSHLPGLSSLNSNRRSESLAEIPRYVPSSNRLSDMRKSFTIDSKSLPPLRQLSALRPLSASTSDLSRLSMEPITRPASASFAASNFTTRNTSINYPKTRQNDGCPFQVDVLKGITGVGLKVKVTAKGHVQITDVQRGGPVEKNGHVRVGDFLLFVNSTELTGQTDARVQQVMRLMPRGLTKLVISGAAPASKSEPRPSPHYNTDSFNAQQLQRLSQESPETKHHTNSNTQTSASARELTVSELKNVSVVNPILSPRSTIEVVKDSGVNEIIQSNLSSYLNPQSQSSQSPSLIEPPKRAPRHSSYSRKESDVKSHAENTSPRIQHSNQTKIDKPIVDKQTANQEFSTKTTHISETNVLGVAGKEDVDIVSRNISETNVLGVAVKEDVDIVSRNISETNVLGVAVKEDVDIVSRNVSETNVLGVAVKEDVDIVSRNVSETNVLGVAGKENVIVVLTNISKEKGVTVKDEKVVERVSSRTSDTIINDAKEVDKISLRINDSNESNITKVKRDSSISSNQTVPIPTTLKNQSNASKMQKDAVSKSEALKVKPQRKISSGYERLLSITGTTRPSAIIEKSGTFVSSTAKLFDQKAAASDETHSQQALAIRRKSQSSIANFDSSKTLSKPVTSIHDRWKSTENIASALTFKQPEPSRLRTKSTSYVSLQTRNLELSRKNSESFESSTNINSALSQKKTSSDSVIIPRPIIQTKYVSLNNNQSSDKFISRKKNTNEFVSKASEINRNKTDQSNIYKSPLSIAQENKSQKHSSSDRGKSAHVATQEQYRKSYISPFQSSIPSSNSRVNNEDLDNTMKKLDELLIDPPYQPTQTHPHDLLLCLPEAKSSISTAPNISMETTGSSKSRGIQTANNTTNLQQVVITLGIQQMKSKSLPFDTIQSNKWEGETELLKKQIMNETKKTDGTKKINTFISKTIPGNREGLHSELPCIASSHSLDDDASVTESKFDNFASLKSTYFKDDISQGFTSTMNASEKESNNESLRSDDFNMQPYCAIDSDNQKQSRQETEILLGQSKDAFRNTENTLPNHEADKIVFSKSEMTSLSHDYANSKTNARSEKQRVQINDFQENPFYIQSSHAEGVAREIKNSDDSFQRNVKSDYSVQLASMETAENEPPPLPSIPPPSHIAHHDTNLLFDIHDLDYLKASRFVSDNTTGVTGEEMEINSPSMTTTFRAMQLEVDTHAGKLRVADQATVAKETQNRSVDYTDSPHRPRDMFHEKDDIPIICPSPVDMLSEDSGMPADEDQELATDDAISPPGELAESAFGADSIKNMLTHSEIESGLSSVEAEKRQPSEQTGTPEIINAAVSEMSLCDFPAHNREGSQNINDGDITVNEDLPPPLLPSTAPPNIPSVTSTDIFSEDLISGHMASNIQTFEVQSFSQEIHLLDNDVSFVGKDGVCYEVSPKEAESKVISEIPKRFETNTDTVTESIDLLHSKTDDSKSVISQREVASEVRCEVALQPVKNMVTVTESMDLSQITKISETSMSRLDTETRSATAQSINSTTERIDSSLTEKQNSITVSSVSKTDLETSPKAINRSRETVDTVNQSPDLPDIKRSGLPVNKRTTDVQCDVKEKTQTNKNTETASGDLVNVSFQTVQGRDLAQTLDNISIVTSKRKWCLRSNVCQSPVLVSDCGVPQCLSYAERNLVKALPHSDLAKLINKANSILDASSAPVSLFLVIVHLHGNGTPLGIELKHEGGTVFRVCGFKKGSPVVEEGGAAVGDWLVAVDSLWCDQVTAMRFLSRLAKPKHESVLVFAREDTSVYVTANPVQEPNLLTTQRISNPDRRKDQPNLSEQEHLLVSETTRISSVSKIQSSEVMANVQGKSQTHPPQLSPLSEQVPRFTKQTQLTRPVLQEEELEEQLPIMKNAVVHSDKTSLLKQEMTDSSLRQPTASVQERLNKTLETGKDEPITTFNNKTQEKSQSTELSQQTYAGSEITRKVSVKNVPSTAASSSPSDVTVQGSSVTLTKIQEELPTKAVSSTSVELGPGIHKVVMTKGATGVGFCLEGGLGSPKGDLPITVKRIFKGGPAEKCGLLKVKDEILEVNGLKFSQMGHYEAWNHLKFINDGEVQITIRRN